MATQIQIFIFALFVTLTPHRGFGQGDFASDAAVAKAKKTTKTTKKKSKKKETVKKESVKKDLGRDALVKQDGAAIYEVANFDSPVLEYMDQGKKIKISRKLFPGVGGLGAFYRVKTKAGFGYIADVDVQLDKGGGRTDSLSEKSPEEKQDIESGVSDPSQLQDSLMGEDSLEPQQGESLYLSKWFGLTYANFSYQEEVANKVRSGDLPMFGMEFAGPTSFMGGFPLDLELLITTTAPSFYDKFTDSVSGFMMLGSGMAVMPLSEFKSGLLFYGLGLVTKYVRWDVALDGQEGKAPLDSQVLTLGAAAEVGLSYVFTQSILFRAEAKYFYEEEKYFGYSVGLQIKR